MMASKNQFKIQGENGQVITATLKRNAFNLFVEPENNLWTYDLSGRLIGVFYKSKTYRRTLDNTFHLKTRTVIDNEEFRDVEIVSTSDAEMLVQSGINICNRIKNSLPERYDSILDQIINHDYNSLINDGKQFSSIYLPISILPPDQYLSLVVQVTEGCNYNKCTFCDFYRDRPFKIKNEEELTAHIDQIGSFLKEGISIRNSVFLADANAVVTPMPRLRRAIELIRAEFPEIKDMYSFIDVFTGLKKSISDLKELKHLGMKRVYLGIESGHLPLLKLLKKPQDLDAIAELTASLRTAGINIGVIFLVGAGGAAFEDQHRKDSIDLIKRLGLTKGDIVYISEFNETNQEYSASMTASGYNIPTRFEIRKWSRIFKESIKNTVSKDVKVAVYDIKQFFY